MNCFAEQDEGPPQTEDSFRHLLTSRTRQTFDEIRNSDRLRANSPDFWPAAHWVLQSARDFGWEASALPVARSVLDHGASHEHADTARLAFVVSAVGSAQAGDAEGARAAFAQLLASLRLRQPNVAADVAQSLALAWQLRGNPQLAADVYEQLAGAFFLNEELRQFAALRTRRLKLLGQPAPAFPQKDLTGAAFDWSEHLGRVVVLDFWATNCRPCLEELPRLRHRFAEFRPSGVDFVGVSFDDNAQTVEQFLTVERIPWRILLGRETAESAYHVELIPCLMIVDRKGTVVATDALPADLSGALDKILANSAEAGSEAK